MRHRALVLGSWCVTMAVGWGQETPAADEAASLDERYAALVAAFRNDFLADDDPVLRRAIVERRSAEAHALLEPHLQSDAIASLIPAMTETVGINLDRAFGALIREHPDVEVQAHATLAVARYWDRNDRNHELIGKTYRLAELQYGDVEVGPDLLRDVAAKERYFFEHLRNGRVAPATVGTDEDGALFGLDDYRGKVVMLRFWGDWCPVCRQMYALERRFVDQWRGEPFALVGVNSDPIERLKDSQSQRPLPWRSFWDGGHTTGPLATSYQVTLWPTVVVIDHEGIIRHYSKGRPEDERLEAVLTHWMAVAKQAATDPNRP